MKRKLSREQVYRLRGHVLRVEDGKFHYSPIGFCGDADNWHGPYANLAAVAKAIAKNVTQEYEKRSTLVRT